MKRFILITETTPNLYDSYRYGLDFFKNKGFETYILNLNDLINKNYKEEINIYKPSINIKNINELQKQIIKLNNNQTFFLINFFPNFKNFRIFLLLKKNNVKTINLICGYQPIDSYENLLRKRSLINLFKKLFFKYFLQISTEVLLYAGKHSINDDRFLIDRNTILLSSHSFDFERTLNVRDEIDNEILKKPYAVFLDQYIFKHPDNISQNILLADKSKYYNELNIFFNKIEKKKKLQIIILAHPRSNYKFDNPFGNRKIIKDKTREYIKYSKLILCHDSTSISFGIIYKKPIINLLSYHYNKRFYNSIKQVSKSLGSRIINLSNYNSLPSNLLYFSDKHYELYFKNYISDKKNIKNSMFNILYKKIIS